MIPTSTLVLTDFHTQGSSRRKSRKRTRALTQLCLFTILENIAPPDRGKNVWSEVAPSITPRMIVSIQLD